MPAIHMSSAVPYLQSVGRVGASLLEPAASSSSQQHHGSTPSDWASTFDSCFELYGGSQAAEELEQLSSECAGICNRSVSCQQLLLWSMSDERDWL